MAMFGANYQAALQCYQLTRTLLHDQKFAMIKERVEFNDQYKTKTETTMRLKTAMKKMIGQQWNDEEDNNEDNHEDNNEDNDEDDNTTMKMTIQMTMKTTM